MKDKKLLIFDLDGTLVDSLNFYVVALREACKIAGVEITEKQVEEYRKRLGKIIDEIIKEVIPQLPQEKRKEIGNLIWDLSEKFIDEIKPIEETIELINSSGDKYEFALFSSSPKKFVRNVLKNLGILEKFRVIIGKEDVNEGKPSPEGILKILEITGFDKENTIFIGDTKFDEEAARRAGVKFLYVDEIHRLNKI